MFIVQKISLFVMCYFGLGAVCIIGFIARNHLFSDEVYFYADSAYMKKLYLKMVLAWPIGLIQAQRKINNYRKEKRG